MRYLNFLFVPAVSTILALSGCGGSGSSPPSLQSGTVQSVSTAATTQNLTAADIANAQAINNSIASLDAQRAAAGQIPVAGTAKTAAAVVAAANSSSSTAPIVGGVKVYPKNAFIVPKSGTLTKTVTFKGFVDGADGVLLFYNSYGKDIPPLTSCTGTPKQIKTCQSSINKALAWNPTSVQVTLNGQTVIAPGQIPRSQGKAQIPIKVNKSDTMQVIVKGAQNSFIQFEAWSQTTLPPPGTPVANFTYNPISGALPLTVNFDATASNSPNGTITGYAWSFGDNSTGSGVTVSHTYTAAGSFNAVLTITDSANMTATRSSTVIVNPALPPVASFISTVPAVGATVSVDANASYSPAGSIVSYTWNWGDGSPVSSGVTASHDYGTSGPFNITLTVTDSFGGTNSSTQMVTVTLPPTGPVANLIYTVGADNMAYFDASTSQSPGASITNYGWGVDQCGSYYLSGPSTFKWLFITSGYHSISLFLWDSLGRSSQTCVSIYVPTTTLPTAILKVNPTTGTSPLTVTFDASSSTPGTSYYPIANYVWDFGDGTTVSGGSQVSHTYQSIGLFPVSLKVYNSINEYTQTSSQVVVKDPVNPTALFTYYLSFDNFTGFPVLNVDASLSSSPNGPITQYFWDWGDGSNFDYGMTASHLYSNFGQFTVTLFVTDSSGWVATQSISNLP